MHMDIENDSLQHTSPGYVRNLNLLTNMTIFNKYKRICIPHSWATYDLQA